MVVAMSTTRPRAVTGGGRRDGTSRASAVSRGGSAADATRPMVSRARAVTRALDPSELGRAVGDLAVGVGLMGHRCKTGGDQIYRSTLDAELRREIAPLLTPAAAVILGTLGVYGTVTPGVIPGLMDFYVARPLVGVMRAYTRWMILSSGKSSGRVDSGSCSRRSASRMGRSTC